jgi:enterochelin esterase family protein
VPPIVRVALALGPALLSLALTAAPARAQMPTAAPMLRSTFIDDCGPAPKGDELCRLPAAFDADEAEARLAGADLAYWIEGQTLNVAARAQADRAVLSGTIEEGMVPLSTRRPLWGAAYRLTAINRSIVELTLKGSAAPAAAWRGPDAPAAPPANAALRGRIETIDIQSVALGKARRVQIYVPPGPAPKGGWPVAFAGGIDDIAPYAAIADALIERRDIRATAIIGLGDGEGDYLRHVDPDAFTRHNMFVRREALPAAARRLALSARPADRLLFGVGAGGDWALDLAAHDPRMAGAVAAFSPRGLSEFPFRNRALRLYLQAGAYETPYLKGARSTCNLAGASNAVCKLDVTDTGHAPLIWQAEWAKVLVEVFPSHVRKR